VPHRGTRSKGIGAQQKRRQRAAGEQGKSFFGFLQRKVFIGKATADDRWFGRNAAQGIIAERAAGVFFGYNTSLAAGDVFVVERDGAGTVQAARFDVPAE